MAIFGRPQFLSGDDRAQLTELSIPGFDGQLDHGFFVRAAQDAQAPRQVFLKSAQLQRRIAQNGATHWAPIHLVGCGAQGPYCVATYYHLTAASLIESRRRLDETELHHIITSVFAGLKELHRLSPQTSANLKPTNVLIEANPDLRRARVLLTDPLADANPSSGPADDLRALGVLIHQLVMHCTPAGGAVAPAFEWSTLGDLGHRWRKLCSRLLDTRPGRVPLAMRSVEKQLHRLNPRRRPVQAFAVAATVLLLIGSAVAIRRPAESAANFARPAPQQSEPRPVQLAMNSPSSHLAEPPPIAMLHSPTPPTPAAPAIAAAPVAPPLRLDAVRAWIAGRWSHAAIAFTSLTDLLNVPSAPSHYTPIPDPVVTTLLPPPEPSLADSLPATPPPSLAAAPPLPDPHPQRAEYDAALRALRDALLAQAKPEAIAGQVLAVEQAIQKLPLADQKETRILTLLKGIAEFRSAPPELSPVDLGPASPAAAAARLIRWKVSIDPQSGTITYSAPAPRQIGTDELLIVFKRIEATPSTPAFYLSTTEISLGLFADVISASAKWADVAPLLWKYTSRNGDPRAGPRAWEWSSTGRGGLGIRRTLVWLAGDGDHYPPRLSSAQSRVVLGDADGRFARELNPSKRQPMQYVSADAAIYFAHLLGARLPTSAELQTALASAEERDANLRDLTWRHQQQWSRAASRPAERTQDWGAFVAPGEADSNDVWTHRQLHLGDDDRPYHDGALWFRDVANNDLQNFAQLIGNVAEYALDGDQLYVVGASALSPPSRSLNKAILVPGGRPAAKGWSDVGFRIALSIPPSPREQLRLAIDGAPLLATAAE